MLAKRWYVKGQIGHYGTLDGAIDAAKRQLAKSPASGSLVILESVAEVRVETPPIIVERIES